MAQTQCLSHFILAGVEGLEPSRTVLETGMLPLHHTPININDLTIITHKHTNVKFGFRKK